MSWFSRRRPAATVELPRELWMPYGQATVVEAGGWRDVGTPGFSVLVPAPVFRDCATSYAYAVTCELPGTPEAIAVIWLYAARVSGASAYVCTVQVEQRFQVPGEDTPRVRIEEWYTDPALFHRLGDCDQVAWLTADRLANEADVVDFEWDGGLW